MRVRSRNRCPGPGRAFTRIPVVAADVDVDLRTVSVRSVRVGLGRTDPETTMPFVPVVAKVVVSMPAPTMVIETRGLMLENVYVPAGTVMVRVSAPSLTNVQPGCGGVPGVKASSLKDVTASATVHALLTVSPVAWAARAERKRAHAPAPMVTKRRA